MKAIVFGGYAPLHRGHLDVIMRAKKENDSVLLIVCGYNGEPRGKEIKRSLNERVGMIRDFFKDDEQIEVAKINDTELGLDESMSPKNWKVWTTETERLAGTSDVLYYVAEPFYHKRLTSIGKRVILMERRLPISGTEIRKDPYKNWEYIAQPFRECFPTGILITGTASEGKTTLCKDISKYFGIPWVPEYGRLWMEERGMTDDKLGLPEFSTFIEQQLLSYPKGEKLWIADTDNLVTLMYAKAYSGRPEMKMTPEEYQSLKIPVPMRWKKIFMLPPRSEKFVDDGTRYMPQSSMTERMKNYETLKQLMKEHGYEYETLEGTYYENFLQVKEYIETL